MNQTRRFGKRLHVDMSTLTFNDLSKVNEDHMKFITAQCIRERFPLKGIHGQMTGMRVKA